MSLCIFHGTDLEQIPSKSCKNPDVSLVVLNTLSLEITACTLATFGFRLPWDLWGRKLSLSSEQRKVALYPRESIQPAKRHLPQLLEFRTERIRLPWASVVAALA